MAQQPVANEIKQEILNKIKNEGLLVKDASTQYGVHHKTIYGWLMGSGGITQETLEIRRLRKENKDLTAIIGALTIVNEKQKRGLMPEPW
ncbi:MAG: Uncharacterized protein FD167_1382 [bacterium]|nr:MAG: Uncharacterized protein FD167_1382 [bacterium]